MLTVMVCAYLESPTVTRRFLGIRTGDAPGQVPRRRGANYWSNGQLEAMGLGPQFGTTLTSPRRPHVYM